MGNLNAIRSHMRRLCLANEGTVLRSLVGQAGINQKIRGRVRTRTIDLVSAIRSAGNPGLMEVFLAEYGLSTEEGVALMCLAEALLRVPDALTIDELIEDKIAPSSNSSLANWGEHLGKSSSSLVNASTWALMLTGKVLKDRNSDSIADILHRAIKRLGEPLIRLAVEQAMKEMGHQFVLGRTIIEALDRSKLPQENGFTFSYDMLGEAAVTARDAAAFFKSYSDAIRTLSARSTQSDIRDNPGISIKLSALHPRYEPSQKKRVMEELVPRVTALAVMAKEGRMGLNIDAEEAHRLDLSLDVIEAVLRSPGLKGWHGLGVVVQAYGKRAATIIDWLYALADELDRKIMVRLVKGAYWDSEIKQAQIDGVRDFPVFTKKAATDVSYICCAKKLLGLTDRIYPQFATHNAHTVSAILELSQDNQSFEFQRLHGMGEALYKAVVEGESTRCRIYAPVGAHKDLLAYLVRRLLENGANSSFVNQIVDKSVTPETIAADPFELMENAAPTQTITNPRDLFQPVRLNSKGWDLGNVDDLAGYHHCRAPFVDYQWKTKPVVAGPVSSGKADSVFNPADPGDHIGYVEKATIEHVEAALKSAKSWGDCKPEERARILQKAADLYEENSGEIFSALCREAGKTASDAVAELREAVDFLRYYASQATITGNSRQRGLITCISPWNFPLAIFTGQIAAALAAGNGVLAKPADPTPIIASIGVRLLHLAGVPKNVLQLLPGPGSVVGARLTSDTRINGICFTGSTGVARTINRVMSSTLEPDAILIAETGGLNAMIVDSTALPQQAIQDIIDSAFRSAGQRCSALRLLYLQKDVATEFLEMLFGAMDELDMGAPWLISSDLGPVISEGARQEINAHIATAKSQGRLLKQLKAPDGGYFVGPAVIEVGGIGDLKKEIFGPVLHVATYEPPEIDQIIEDINNAGYGLTFGLHTRIDKKVEQITTRLNVGNIYVNRNQIGAVVGSQPFGGEGLSGTGPKAGGPHYVTHFTRRHLPGHKVVSGPRVDVEHVRQALNSVGKPARKPLKTFSLAGPTGESNRLSLYPRGMVLCLGPTVDDARKQSEIAREMGCSTLCVVPGISGPDSVSGFIDRRALSSLNGFDAVALWSAPDDLTNTRVALAKRDGPILPVFSTDDMKLSCVLERHVCIDTTAAGGNASLLARQ
jgi:RHH-type transcriptional regulator, proline utilization regulon repressor / proline dehydrogenase / delta 1-pyrroline-5-carboxylate dehydrogenase